MTIWPRFVVGGGVALVAWAFAAVLLAPVGGYDPAGPWRSVQLCGAIYVAFTLLGLVAGTR